MAIRKIVKGLLLASSVAVCVGAFAEMEDVNPLVGIDFKQTWARGNDGLSDVLPKSYPGFDIFVGSRFHENFGVEVGYDWSLKKHKHSTGTTVYNGYTVNGPIKTSARFQGPRLEVAGFLPLENSFELVGRVGLSYVKANLHTVGFQTTTVTDASGNAVSNPWGSETGKSKLLMRAAGGAQYMVADNVGLRGLVGWENYSRLRMKDVSSKVFKDSVSLTVGAFYKF